MSYAYNSDFERALTAPRQGQGDPWSGLGVPSIYGRWSGGLVVDSSSLPEPQAGFHRTSTGILGFPSANSASTATYILYSGNLYSGNAGGGLAYRTIAHPLEWSKPVAAAYGIVPLIEVVGLDPRINQFMLSGSLSPSGSMSTGMITCFSIADDLDIPSVLNGPLAGYEEYAQPNWDGYDAEPIAPETLHAARFFLDMLPKTLGEPDIAPGADGTIGLEWSFTNRSLRKLFIDIGPGAVWGGYWRRATGETRTISADPITSDTKHALKELFDGLSA
jgi:hypothetical protein